MSSSYIWIGLNFCMPLEFDMPDCHECKWTALPKPMNTIGIHAKLQLQAGKCKHLSHLPVPALFLSFLVSFCTLLPGLHLPSFCTSSYFTRYTTITAGLSLTPLCHSDTTWYHQDERYVSRHSDALIWSYPNWISLPALLSDTGSQNVASLIKVCSAWPLQGLWCDEQWASDNFIPQIGTTNGHW